MGQEHADIDVVAVAAEKSIHQTLNNDYVDDRLRYQLENLKTVILLEQLM